MTRREFDASIVEARACATAMLEAMAKRFPCFGMLEALGVMDPASIIGRENESDYGERSLQREFTLHVLRVVGLLITVIPDCDVCVLNVACMLLVLCVVCTLLYVALALFERR